MVFFSHVSFSIKLYCISLMLLLLENKKIMILILSQEMIMNLQLCFVFASALTLCGNLMKCLFVEHEWTQMQLKVWSIK